MVDSPEPEKEREAFPVGLKLVLPFHVPFQDDDYAVKTPYGVMQVSLVVDPQAHKRQTKNQQYVDEANTTVVVTFGGVSKGVHLQGEVSVINLECLKAYFADTIVPLTDSIIQTGNRSVCFSRIAMQTGIKCGEFEERVDYAELAAVFHIGASAINRLLSAIRVVTSYFDLPLINEDYSQFEVTSSVNGRPLYVFHRTGDVKEVWSISGYSDTYIKVEDSDYQQVTDIVAKGEETLLDDNRFIIDANAAFFQGDYQTAIVLLQIQLEYELSKEMKAVGLSTSQTEGLGKKFIYPLAHKKKTKEWTALKLEWDNYRQWKRYVGGDYQKIDDGIGAFVEAYILRNKIVHEGKAVSREDAVEAFLAYTYIMHLLFKKMVFLPRVLSGKMVGTFG